MPTYRVLVKSYINNTIIDPETMSEAECVVEYDGKPGSNLELIEGSASKAEQAAGEAESPKKGFARKAAKADAE